MTFQTGSCIAVPGASSAVFRPCEGATVKVGKEGQRGEGRSE